MLSKILVSIDSNQSSQHALTQISALARSEKSHLVLVSVIPPFEDGNLRFMGKKKVLDDLIASYKTALENAGNLAKEYGISQKSVLEEGEPFAKILSMAEKEHVDLIVVDTKSSILWGLIPNSSIAPKVVSQSVSDILVVPDKANLNLDRLLLAYDDSKSSMEALKRAIELSVAYGSELTIVKAYEVALEGFSYDQSIWNETSRKAKEALDDAGLIAQREGVRKVETVMRHGKASTEICELARKINAGLIIMGSRPKNILKKMLVENVMEKVIRNESVPVWIAKN